MSTDQFRAPRVEFRQLAEVVHQDPATGFYEQVMGSTIDIGSDGVRFQADHGFDLGAVVSICLSVGERIIEARGAVTEATPAADGNVEMNIQFTELSDRDREFIEELCRERATHE
ncbi:MAG: hypothetical protein GXP25_02495 [Planctomycetes bacterium]|nr:hypothetical protein [Planctomycetota bacterium]